MEVWYVAVQGNYNRWEFGLKTSRQTQFETESFIKIIDDVVAPHIALTFPRKQIGCREYKGMSILGKQSSIY